MNYAIDCDDQSSLLYGWWSAPLETVISAVCEVMGRQDWRQRTLDRLDETIRLNNLLNPHIFPPDTFS